MAQILPSADSKAPEPHRLLFLHGLFRKTYPHSGRTVADLLAKGLEGASVSAAPDLLLDDGGRCHRYLVQATAAVRDWRPIEVVDVTYDDVIRSHDSRRPLIQRAGIGLWLLLSQSWRLWRLVLPGHPRLTAAQVSMTYLMGFAFFAAVLLMAALIIPVLYGAYGYLIVLLEGAGLLSAEPEPSQDGKGGWITSEIVVGSVAFLALLAAAGKLLIWKSYAEVFEDAGHCMFALLNYQRPTSTIRQALLARVASALRASTGEDGERPVSILAFSQGSILAIDTLFPLNSSAEEEAAASPGVDMLITLGCPLAILHRLWPARPIRPSQPPDKVLRWVNYYETNDKLGGEIAALIKAEGIEAKVEDREFCFTLPSGRISDSPHITYWMDGPEDQRPSATLIAPELVGLR